MPRIVRLHAFGGPENLRVEEAPFRPLGAGEARLRVEAASVNRDHYTFMSGHQFKGHGFVQPELPSRLGYEAAGVVEAVGEGVDRSWIGKRVAPFPGFDESRYGTLGEEAVVPAGTLCEYPSRLTSAQAAAFWVPFLTAYGALVAIARVGAGDFVSVPAASSAVGLAAVQLARDAGATAIAVTRTSGKREELLSLGASHVIVTAEEEYEDRVRAITGGQGVRITFDPVGGPFLERLAAAAAPGGIVVEYGRLSGQPTPFPLMPVVGKGLSIRGYTMSEVTRDPRAVAEAKQYVLDRLADGRFLPRIARTFPLDETVEAYRFLMSDQQVGRVVIAMP